MGRVGIGDVKAAVELAAPEATVNREPAFRRAAVTSPDLIAHRGAAKGDRIDAHRVFAAEEDQTPSTLLNHQKICSGNLRDAGVRARGVGRSRHDRRLRYFHRLPAVRLVAKFTVEHITGTLRRAVGGHLVGTRLPKLTW
jgi:hypothetical protein